MSVGYFQTGVSKCDAANFLLKARRPRLVQHLRRAYAASNDENTVSTRRIVVCRQDEIPNIIQIYNKTCANIQGGLN
jgi:hypothetical protein